MTALTTTHHELRARPRTRRPSQPLAALCWHLKQLHRVRVVRKYRGRHSTEILREWWPGRSHCGCSVAASFTRATITSILKKSTDTRILIYHAVQQRLLILPVVYKESRACGRREMRSRGITEVHEDIPKSWQDIPKSWQEMPRSWQEETSLCCLLSSADSLGVPRSIGFMQSDLLLGEICARRAWRPRETPKIWQDIPKSWQDTASL